MSATIVSTPAPGGSYGYATCKLNPKPDTHPISPLTPFTYHAVSCHRCGIITWTSSWSSSSIKPKCSHCNHRFWVPWDYYTNHQHEGELDNHDKRWVVCGSCNSARYERFRTCWACQYSRGIMGTEWPTPTECEHCRYVFDGSEVSGWRRMWEEVDMEDVIRGWKRKNREMREKGGEKKCDHCGKTFKGLKGLKTHQRNCFSWKPYKKTTKAETSKKQKSA